MPYIAFVHPPVDDSEWGVTFPDVPGCVSGASSFEEAVEAAQEALSGHLSLLAADGDPLPPARTWADLQRDPAAFEEAEGAIAQLILPSQLPSGQTLIDVAIDAGLLQRTDAAARARGLSRSAFIAVALSEAAEGVR